MENMNILIEPDSVNIKNIIGNFINKKKILEKPINDKNELKKFIEETITQSNFTTRNRNAHYSIICNRYRVEENDNSLIKKYLKGRSPNDLLLEKEKLEIYNDNQEEKNYNYEINENTSY